MTFRKIGTRLQGHPSMDKCRSRYVNGFIGTKESLAAVGMALSNKYHNLPYRIYTLLGDGECQEGEVWEAAMSASHYGLDNLLAFVDMNGLQIDGKVSEVMNPFPLDEKFKALEECYRFGRWQ